MSMDLETRLSTILALLKGVKPSSGGFKALCPIGDTNQSLSITRGPEGRILIHCFQGCETEDVMSALGLPMGLLSGKTGQKHKTPKRKEVISSVPTQDDEKKVKNAVRLYNEARHLPGTPGAEYLQGRSIPVDLAHANGARYHPRFPFKLTHAPAVVFPILSGDRTGKIVAVNARFLNPDRDTDGEKQRSAGKPSWGAFGVRGAVEPDEVLVAEAPIDALSLAVAGFPALATCGASNLRHFPKLFDGKTIICAFDLDSNPNTQSTIRKNMARLKDGHAGRVVWLKPPGNGLKDWNDVLRQYGHTGLAFYLRRAGAKCKPAILKSPDEPGIVESIRETPTIDDSWMAPYIRPPQPSEPCYACKSRNWWFQKVSRSWVCARCHPDPVQLRMEWERRKSTSLSSVSIDRKDNS